MTPLCSLATEPSLEPVTVAEVKQYLRIDGDDDDALLGVLITAARTWVETYTRRALITQTWDQRFPVFPVARRPLYLTKAPVQSVTSITYVDDDGATQTWATTNYTLRTFAGQTAGRAWIEVTDDTTTPSVDSNTEYPVIVRTVCGYGLAAAMPAGLKAALYVLLADLYENRAALPSPRTQTTVERLLAPFRLPEAV